MTKHEKFPRRFMDGQADADIAFDELRALLERLGFQVRIRGSHHIFTKTGIDELINLQPLGTRAKPYQVKLVRNILRSYQLDKEKR